jgi:hypothetical protein
MFADYSLSVNDRIRILNLVNDGKIKNYVNRMGDNDVLFLKINVNKFPGPYHISIRDKSWIKEMEMNYDEERSNEDSQSIVDSFEEINEQKSDDTVTVHIQYVTGENYVQTSTFNIPKKFFDDEDNVIGELIEENVVFTTEFMKSAVKKNFKQDKTHITELIKNMDNDNIVVMIETPFSQDFTPTIHIKEDMKKYLKKRLINIDLSDKVLLYIIRDGYRYHGIGFTRKEVDDFE